MSTRKLKARRVVEMIKLDTNKSSLHLFLLLSILFINCSAGMGVARDQDRVLLKCSGNGVPSYFLDENSKKQMECICSIGFKGEQCILKQDLGEILNGARDGDAGKIKSLWREEKVDPNSIIAGKILRVAASNNRVEIVELLLAFGVNVDHVFGASWDDFENLRMENIVAESVKDGETSRDGGLWEKRLREEGLTALMTACKYGQNATVELLLDRGASVNARSFNGRSALMLASASGNGQIVDLLVRRGASVFDRDINDDSALMYAIAGRDRRSIELLLSLGDDPNRKNTHGVSPMTFIEEQGDGELREFFKAGKNAQHPKTNAGVDDEK